MPLYSYKCKKCEKEFEAVQKFSDDPLTKCEDEQCDGEVAKTFPTSTSFVEGKRYASNPYMKKGR